MKKIDYIGGLLVAVMIVIFIAVIPAADNPPAYDPIVRTVGQTTNATPSSLLIIPLGTGQTVRITTDVLALSGNSRMRGVKTATIKNISGSLSIIGGSVQDVVSISADAGLAASLFTITTSGTNVIVQVTGIVGTVNWIANTTSIFD